MPIKIRYYLYDGLSLVNCLQTHAINYICKDHNCYQPKKNDIIIGLLKIFDSLFLLYIYLKKVGWEEKIYSGIIGIIIYFVTLLYDYLWSSILPFYNPKSKLYFAARVKYTENTPNVQFSFHHLKHILFFPKLSKSFSEKTFYFPQFFTKGGFFIADDWNNEVESLIQPFL